MASLMGELSGVDLLEATRTDERSTREELRCVLAVIRHGDRTPKQKLKVNLAGSMFWAKTTLYNSVAYLQGVALLACLLARCSFCLTNACIHCLQAM